MKRQCVVLAGGLGTRLGSLTQDSPKPLLPIAGRPFLAYICDNLRRQSINRITILAGFKGEQIRDFFANDGDVEVLIEPEPQGTGGALRFAAQSGALEDEFFLINGDTYFDINLADLMHRPLSGGGQAMARMALRRMSDTGRFGVVLCSGSLVREFAARPAEVGQPGDVNGGVYYLRRELLNFLPEGKSSLEEDVFPKLVTADALHAFSYDAGFIDIGIPSEYERAQTYVPSLGRRRALFLDRDGVLNEDIGYLHKIEDFRWVDGALELIKTAADRGYFIFVVTNQAGIARGYYQEADVKTLHDWMKVQAFDHGGYLSDFRFCPHHRDGIVPKFAVECNCRKPASGMLLDLKKSYDIDLEGSLMVGDNLTDLEAASGAGVKGFLFEGGNLADFIRPQIVSR